MRRLEVHLLPALVQPEELRGWSVVVIDVLRATSTICHALNSGARQVFPCSDIEGARAKAAGLSGEAVLLGGERGGVLIDGFDLGNSPLDYSPQNVRDKTIVFTTTNGTLAIARAEHAAEVLIGSLNNAGAVARHLAQAQQAAILCAGTQGRITAEDVLAAGAIIDQLSPADEPDRQMNDEARLARALFGDGKQLMEVLRESRGGQNLRRLGYDADIETAAQLDSLDILPRLNKATGAITA